MKKKTLAMFLAYLLVAPAFGGETLRKYGVQTTVYFSLIDPAGIDLETAASCATGGGAADDDVQISKDGGAFADATNCFTNEGNGVYSLVLSSTEMQACNVAVTVIDDATKVWLDAAVFVETYGNASACHEVDLDAAGFAASQTVIVKGTVDTGSFSATTTQFEADDITEATADHFNGRVIIFTSGALLYQAATITDYSLQGANGRFTVSGLTEAPGNNDTFVIL